MTKADFIEIMRAIQAQIALDKAKAMKLGEVFSNAFVANLIYDNSILINSLVNLLSKYNQISVDIIEWFIYDNDFGKNEMTLIINEEPINITDIESFYDTIIL